MSRKKDNVVNKNVINKENGRVIFRVKVTIINIFVSYNFKSK